MRDSQVSKVYRAEVAMWRNKEGTWVGNARYGHPPIDFDTPRELQQFVNKVTRSQFWKRCGGRPMVHAKANNRWYNNAHARAQQLDIPPWAMTKSTVLHEMTHALSYRLMRKAADHGPEFVLVFRRLVEEHMGEDVRRQFDLHLEEAGARWGLGSIPPGKMTAENPNST